MTTEPETSKQAAQRLAAERLCVCGHTMKEHYGQTGNLGCDECEKCRAFTDAAVTPTATGRRV